MQMLGDNKNLLANRFQNLVREHRDLDIQVNSITSRNFINAEQREKLSHLKKLKLSKKDQIETLRSNVS